jgi:hypothetical protein
MPLQISRIVIPPLHAILVDLLLLVDAVFSWTAVYEQQESANDGKDLEKVVLGKVLVGVVLVELEDC